MWRRVFKRSEEGQAGDQARLKSSKYFSTLQICEGISLQGEFSCTPKQVLQEII